MASPWSEFEAELARRRERGAAPVFWWRDDDAGAPTAEIGRLIELSAAAEDDARALERLAAARRQLEAMAGTWALAVLAPPWNRLRASLAARLSEIGIRGLSAYGPRPAMPPGAGLTQINTHADIVAWHAGRSFIGDEAALALLRRQLASGSDEPIGILTHHAVHEASSWRFLERLFQTTLGQGARWAHPAQVFVPATR